MDKRKHTMDCFLLSLPFRGLDDHTHTYTHTHIYIYIYIYFAYARIYWLALGINSYHIPWLVASMLFIKKKNICSFWKINKTKVCLTLCYVIVLKQSSQASWYIYDI
jgi:hypothetical protein